jgi:hypothetical protein
MRLGRLLIVLLDRYCTMDIAKNYKFLILKLSSYLKFNIFMPLRRDLPGRKVPYTAVLPTSCENLLPDQTNPSAAGKKIRTHINFTRRGQYGLRPKFWPLGNTACLFNWRKRMPPRANETPPRAN